MRHIVAVLVAFFSLVVVGSAGSQAAVMGPMRPPSSNLVGIIGTLMNLDTLSLAPNTGGTPCGQYFKYTTVPSTVDSLETNMTFVVTYTNQGTGAKFHVVNGRLGLSKIQVHVWKDPQTPREAKVVRIGGPVTPWVEVSLSEADFKLAPCLAKAAVARHPK